MLKSEGYTNLIKMTYTCRRIRDRPGLSPSIKNAGFKDESLDHFVSMKALGLMESILKRFEVQVIKYSR
jgi:hypothetical protein